jgi:hypothetical protein
MANYQIIFFLLCLKCSALGDDVMTREDGAPRPNVQVNILLGRHQDVDAVASNTVTAVHQMTVPGSQRIILANDYFSPNIYLLYSPTQQQNTKHNMSRLIIQFSLDGISKDRMILVDALHRIALSQNENQ